MKLTEAKLKQLIKEEIQESRLRRHLKIKKVIPAESTSSPREVEKKAKHPFMKYFVTAYANRLSREEVEELHALAVKMNVDPYSFGFKNDGDINDEELFRLILNSIANGDRDLAIAISKNMMADGTLPDDFLLAAKIK